MFGNTCKNMLSSDFAFVLISSPCTVFFCDHQVLADSCICYSFGCFQHNFPFSLSRPCSDPIEWEQRILQITLKSFACFLSRSLCLEIPRYFGEDIYFCRF